MCNYCEVKEEKAYESSKMEQRNNQKSSSHSGKLQPVQNINEYQTVMASCPIPFSGETFGYSCFSN